MVLHAVSWSMGGHQGSPSSCLGWLAGRGRGWRKGSRPRVGDIPGSVVRQGYQLLYRPYSSRHFLKMKSCLEKEFEYDLADPLKRLLITDAVVSNPENDKSMRVKCMWDTGATGTCISHSVVRELGLKPISAVVAQGANGSDRLSIYLINIDLGPSAFDHLPVAGLLDVPNQVADIILGMDIIGRGNLHLTHRNGKLLLRWEWNHSGSDTDAGTASSKQASLLRTVHTDVPADCWRHVLFTGTSPSRAWKDVLSPISCKRSWESSSSSSSPPFLITFSLFISEDCTQI